MRRYGEKEPAILDAALRLLTRGGEVGALTVAEIAQEAGVGKGTVYEYYQSKEELIARALLHGCRTNVEELRRELQGHAGFEAQLHALLALIARWAQGGEGVFSLVLFSRLSPEVLRRLKELQPEEKEREDGIYQEMYKLYLLGVEEGVLRDPGDMAYVETVFGSALMGFTGTVFHRDRDPACLQAARENVCRMIKKSLN